MQTELGNKYLWYAFRKLKEDIPRPPGLSLEELLQALIEADAPKYTPKQVRRMMRRAQVYSEEWNGVRTRWYHHWDTMVHMHEKAECHHTPSLYYPGIRCQLLCVREDRIKDHAQGKGVP